MEWLGRNPQHEWVNPTGISCQNHKRLQPARIVAITGRERPKVCKNAFADDEIAINVDFLQDLGRVSRSTCICWNDTFKTQFSQVEFVDEDIDYTHRVGIGHTIVEAFGGSG